MRSAASADRYQASSAERQVPHRYCSYNFNEKKGEVARERIKILLQPSLMGRLKHELGFISHGRMRAAPRWTQHHIVSAATAGKHLHEIKYKLEMNPKEAALLVSLLRGCLILWILQAWYPSFYCFCCPEPPFPNGSSSVPCQLQ